MTKRRPGVVSDQVPPSQPRPQIASQPVKPRPTATCANCGKCPTCGR